MLISKNCILCGKPIIRQHWDFKPNRKAYYCSRRCAGFAKNIDKRPTLKQRFENLFIPEPNSGCWLWIGAYDGSGYGRMMVSGRNDSAHRISWVLHRSDIPNGLSVCHKCDVRPCVNPDHLWLGTHKENMNDALRKGKIGKLSWETKRVREQIERMG